MRINIWIKIRDIDTLAYIVSDKFQWDNNTKIDTWHTYQPGHIEHGIDFVQVSITYDHFKRLEDL